LIGLVKPIEHMRKMFRRDATATVGNSDPDDPVVAPRSERDVPARRRVP